MDLETIASRRTVDEQALAPGPGPGLGAAERQASRRRAGRL